MYTSVALRDSRSIRARAESPLRTYSGSEKTLRPDWGQDWGQGSDRGELKAFAQRQCWEILLSCNHEVSFKMIDVGKNGNIVTVSLF